uniref:Uncharacterized protein n=1 Tax=Tanacetum cinerariifolium TaxID=118510 RepID=A0A6L2MFB0_TANCI|nr:hypothetical protein [Tanacetum cinerariifolium]
MDKKKRFKLTLEILRDIFKIFPIVQGQDFDELPIDEEIVSFLRELGHSGEISSLNDVIIDQMHQPWRTFATLINRCLSRKTTGLDKLRLFKAQILYDKTVFWRNKVGMHTSKDDYLINTLRFVSAKEATQIYGAIHPESLTILEIKETKAYKTYLGFTTRATPPKIARKFKKACPFKNDLNLNLVPVDEETKSAKKKVYAKKIKRKQTSGVVIRDTHVESSSKRKEKVDVTSGKGVELLSEVALTEEAQYEEVRKKSLRDLHKTHLSGSATVTKTTPSAAKIKPSVTNEVTSVKPRVPDVTEEVSTDSEPESWGRDEDDNNNEQDSRSEGSDQQRDSGDDNTQSDSEKGSHFEHETDKNESDSESDQEENEEGIFDKAKGDEDEEIDYTTSQLYDDMDIWLNKLVQADDETIQKEGIDAKLINIQKANENLKIYQVIEDAHVTLSTVLHKTEVSITSSSSSSDLTSKFLNFLDIPHIHAEIVSPIDVYVHHEVPSKKTPTLLTVPVLVITESSPIYSTIIPYMVAESLEHAILAKESSQPQSSYEATASLIEFELKKILIDKMDKSESYLAAPEHIEYKDEDEDPFTRSDRGLKKRKTSKDEEPQKSEKPEFKVADSDMPQDQKENPGPTQSWLMTLTSSTDKPSKTFDELMITPIEISAYVMNDLKISNLTKETLLGPAFKLLKGTRSNYLELEYEFKECYKALSKKLNWDNPKGGDYPFDLTKPLPLVMNGNHQMVPVDYFFNNDIKDQHKSFYRYARGLQSRHDVYSTKRILVVTRVKVMRKHGYGYLKEIIVRRANNDLYTFKEGDLLRLHINDIKDMLLIVVQNRLTNLLSDDVSNFAIKLRIFTRSLVIQKLMRSDKLYKFSGRTLTGLQTSLDDIIKNILMEYLPQRRWSTLEKKRANIMIKAIDKL